MSEPRDPYDVLQVALTADDTVIRAAYRALAHRYHPDVAGPEGEARMREINAAWHVLGDPGRRAAYDLARAEPETSQATDVPMSTEPPDWRTPNPEAASRPGATGSAPPWTGAAGPPPGHPSGSVLDFGVYFGWSLGEIARFDSGYLAWLEHKREGRAYAGEIDAILRRLKRRGTGTTDPPSSRRQGSR